MAGVLQRPERVGRTGQFDYRAYLSYLGIYFQLRTESTNDWTLLPPDAHKPARVPLADRFCTWAQGVLARGLPGEDESLRLLWAMVLGWKTALTPEVAEPFMQSGTLHIFAISGLHIALIADILVRLLQVVRVRRRLSGIVVIPLIWFYTAATGWQASAIRSTVMMTIVIGGWALERPTNLLNSLAAAALVILGWDPQQLFQASFQLSFFVVLGLALIVPWLKGFRHQLLASDPFVPAGLRPPWQRWLDRVLRLITASFGTSLAAWLGSMPLIAYYFFMVTPGSLFANLVIVPLSSLALMSSLGSLVCGDWLSFLTVLFNHTSWFCMLGMIRLSEWFAQLPGAYFYVTQPSPAAFALYYLVLGAFISGIVTAKRWRRWSIVALLLLFIGVCSAWVLKRREIRLTLLPTAAGTAFFEHHGSGQSVLIDPGDERAAQGMVKPFLKAQGVNRLGTLLVSQGDLRHCGGLELLQSHFGARQIGTPAGSSRSPAYKRLLERLATSKSRAHQLSRSDCLEGWTILHPAKTDHFGQADNYTLVLQREILGTKVLLLSSLGRTGQRTLVERQPDLHADVVVTSISNAGEAAPDFILDAVRPKLVVVASSDFPARARASAACRARLARSNLPVVYTSDSGAVWITFERRRWQAHTMDGQRWTFRSGGAAD